MRAISCLGVVLLIARICRADNFTDGVTAFKDGRYSVALSKLQDGAKDPQNRLAPVFLALTRAALGDCKGALPGLLEETHTTDPVTTRMRELAAVKCYSATGDNASAFQLLQRMQQEFPGDADVLYTSAKLHMKAFNDAMLAMFQHAPASYRVHELSAEIFETQNRFSEAINEYKKAIGVNPNAVGLHYRLGRAILLESHSPDALAQAATQFHVELGLSPEDGACEFQLGQIARVNGNVPEAKKHFERSIQFSPSFAEAFIALGTIYSQQKQFDQAIAALKRATQLQPMSESAHYALLTAYRDSGQTDKAKAEKLELDRLQKPPEGEFSQFLNKLGEKPREQ